MPAELEPAAAWIEWLGPEVDLGELPRLEIAHDGAGNATLVGASWGAAARLAPKHLPDWVEAAAAVHVAALPSARLQLRFVEAVRKRGGSRLSAGTYARAIGDDAAGVRRLFDLADIFFLNENEARLLFGGLERVPARPGRPVYVTRGRRGARVVEESRCSDVAAVPAEERDPTGAGDSFCGAALAALVAGADPVEAARMGNRLAAATITGIGPAALLETLDGRL